LLKEDVNFEIHGRLSLFPTVVITIVFPFRVDPSKQKLQEPRGTSERLFVESKDEIKEALHDILTDQQVGNSLEVFKVLVVRLLGGVEDFLHKDHDSIEEVFILYPVEHLMNRVLNDTTLEPFERIRA
jgi:hypothetical protein